MIDSNPIPKERTLVPVSESPLGSSPLIETSSSLNTTIKMVAGRTIGAQTTNSSGQKVKARTNSKSVLTDYISKIFSRGIKGAKSKGDVQATKRASIEKQAEKVTRIFSGVVYELMAQGKAKLVWAKRPDYSEGSIRDTPIDTQLYITAVGNQKSKKKEITDEIELGKKIRESCKDPADYSNLDIAMEVNEELSKSGELVVTTTRAEGALDSIAKNPKLTLAERAKLIYGIAKGVNQLHKLGRVHGDMKLENVLGFGDNVAKLTDFGKSKQVNEGTLIYSGNTRHGAPEGTLSKKSDIFGAGMMICEILEEIVLPEPPEEPMLKIDGQRARESGLDFTEDSYKPVDKRRGIERFRVKMKASHCVETENFSSKKLRKAVEGSRRAKALVSHKNKGEEALLHFYIDTLSEKLQEKYSDPSLKAPIEEMCNFIKKTLNSNPKERPTSSELEAACEKFEQVTTAFESQAKQGAEAVALIKETGSTLIDFEIHASDLVSEFEKNNFSGLKKYLSALDEWNASPGELQINFPDFKNQLDQLLFSAHTNSDGGIIDKIKSAADLTLEQKKMLNNIILMHGLTEE